MEIKPVIGVVLAGGKSARMAGINKPELVFHEKTLVSRAVKRLALQVPDVYLSAPQSYGLSNIHIVDQLPAQGPLGGVFSVLSYLKTRQPNVKAIVTVPVDAPFFPDDLVGRLAPIALENNCPVFAETDDGWQPTFSCWPVSVLPALKKHMEKGEAGSLKGFLKKMRAINIYFDDPHMFFNINRPEDLNEIL